MNSIAIAIMAACLLTCIIYIINLHSSLSGERNKREGSEKELQSLRKWIEDKKSESKIEIEEGDTAILPDYGLSTKEENPISFYVTYEVQVEEISQGKAKVRAIGYTSQDIYANDPANKSTIIAFLQNQWVDKSRLELVMDEKKKRSIKLNKLGI
jgi:hypothetical protein